MKMKKRWWEDGRSRTPYCFFSCVLVLVTLGPSYNSRRLFRGTKQAGVRRANSALRLALGTLFSTWQHRLGAAC